MKLTLKNIKELKSNATPLEKRVLNYIVDEWGNYDDKKNIFTDVLNYGCQSGMVGFLIYYSDTTKFYKRYQEEINSLFTILCMKQVYTLRPKYSEINGIKKIRWLQTTLIKTYLRGLALKKPCEKSDITSNN